MGVVKNILLTGGTGYLGSNLAKMLVEQNCNVFILKRKSSSLNKLEPILDKVELFDVEHLDYNQLFKQKNIQAVLHTATAYGRKQETITEIYNTNIVFPLNVLEACLNNGVKYFFNSTTTLPLELNLYAFTKNQFSELLKFYNSQINIVDIQLEYFYGPGDDDSKFVSFIISKIQSGATEINLSPCTQIRDFIYIDDVVNAYKILLNEHKDFSGYIQIPLGCGHGISLKDLIDKIKATFNSNINLNYGALPQRPNEIMYSVADVTYLNNKGWFPKYSIDKGLKKIITEKINYDSN